MSLASSNDILFALSKRRLSPFAKIAVFGMGNAVGAGRRNCAHIPYFRERLLFSIYFRIRR